MFRKIINDPVYGFITIDSPLVLAVINHPWFQRLRRINQMALAQLVYPGAVHTRLHHALGAYHLMSNALTELKGKGILITEEEELGAKLAILLHDIGHGPFSHALESVLLEGAHHEDITLGIMETLNTAFEGALNLAIKIFTNEYPKKFLHQLVSGQLDVDRMDYLIRDSFFTGVSEGVIGYDRILKMLTVHNGELMVEEKGIFSIEKFLVARRLMYWQVYLHKTVLGAEIMLINILKRAREIGAADMLASGPLQQFLQQNTGNIKDNLDAFCLLDDADILSAIKIWSRHKDIVLQTLCSGILNRTLFKVQLQSEPIDETLLDNLLADIAMKKDISVNDAKYLALVGEAENRTYNPFNESIKILFKNGSVKDISQVDNALIQHNLSATVKKFYICYLK